MSLKALQDKISLLESQLKKLRFEYHELEKDKLMIYHLLYKVNHELDEALHNKQTFIASISHELRSPLTAILGYSELLDHTSLSKEQRRYLHRLDDSAQYLRSLLSDLLDVAKLKDNKITLDLKEHDLSQLLQSCANMIESKMAENVLLIVHVPSYSHAIHIDKKRLQQIMINLLTNAAKFTQQGYVKLALTGIIEKGEEVEFTVEVQDTGPGIPHEIRDTLFEPFQSTDTTEGTGLGLYISQQLAQLMGGAISVESDEGVGTRFHTTFRCRRSQKLTGANANARCQPHSHSSANAYTHLKGLLVEDIPISREYILEMLKTFFGLECDSAENGEIAVQKIRENHYDFILMDMRMPKMNGVEATKIIRTFNPTVPIICMSANVYREDKHAAYAAGMNDFIEKPLERSDIESTLFKYINPANEYKRTEVTPTPKTATETSLQQIAYAHLSGYFDDEKAKHFINIAQENLTQHLNTLQKHWNQRNTHALIDDFHA
ncbi:MAG TPA: response regulator, partial [Campylobacterales bacterium]|nr:response regulator [Campylobacterales bacterium]